ncbi:MULTISPECIES: hypothetical protein [Rhizobium/Agrobacterium group]|uniref:hypothetical protein n=1 Tax=Rhizobium/Agrobacterium group TaxID=227290 RepID=UPI001878FE11|nr:MULTISPECIES: hypothetical protein [Rhizobium/Agrobacterium group]
MTGAGANALFCRLFPTKTKNLSTAMGVSGKISACLSRSLADSFLPESPQFPAFRRQPSMKGKAVGKKNKKTSQKPLRFFSDPNTSRPPTRRT